MGRTEKHYIKGYPSLAAFIASDRDKTTLIFKRFDRLAARNLLHFQSELARLEAEQDALDDQASHENLDSKQCLRNWEDFLKAAATDPKQKRRHELALEIERKMKDYGEFERFSTAQCNFLTAVEEALIRKSTLANLERPTERTLKAFRIRFFNEDSDAEEPFPTLGGNSAYVYDNKDDLVGLRVSQDQDRLTTFVRNHWSFLFQTSPSDGGIVYFSDARIAHFVACVSVLLAPMLLIGPIVSLYFIQSPDWQLGTLTAFTVAFAASVGLLTNAKRAELFAATAA